MTEDSAPTLSQQASGPAQQASGPADQEQAPPDPQLLERCKAGDASAFEEILRRYQGMVYNLIYRMVGQRAEAEDLFQDVFLRVYQRIGEFEQRSSLGTWIYRITVNRVLDYRRAARKFPILGSNPGHDAEDNPGPIRADSASGPVAEVEAVERHAAVHRALLELEEELRTAILLRDIQGRSYAEIAEILDCPIGTVRSRIHRARTILKEKLRALLVK